jgi:clan AA aspartic protease (TIGR02281 family)
MRIKSAHTPLLVAVGLLFTVAVRAAHAADATGSPNSLDDVMKTMGLTKSGSLLVIADEADVHIAANKVHALKSTLAAEANARLDATRALDDANREWLRLEEEMRSLNEKAKAEKDPDQVSALIVEHNETLRKQREKGAQIGQLEKREGKIDDSLPAYTEAVGTSARDANTAALRYAALARDAALKSAIAKYNATAAQHVNLGPSAAFANDVAFLNKCATELAADAIPARMDHGVPVVKVAINGKTQEMVWDSGATVVSLSAETAAAFGLHATDQDPTVESTLANGQSVKSKLVVVPEIRLGGFVATKVECVISPPSDVRPPDLLGGAFQCHFLCRVDQQAGLLHLTPIDKWAWVDPNAVHVSSTSSMPTAVARSEPTIRNTPAPVRTPLVGNPQDIFTGNGLTKLGVVLVTGEEPGVHNATKAVRAWKSKLVSEALARADLKRTMDTATHQYDQLEAQLTALDARLKQLKDNPDQYNQLVNPYNQTLAQVKLQWGKVQALQDRVAKLENSRSVYVDAVVRAVRSANGISDHYAALASDPTMQAAIQKYNSTATRALKLGPAAGFAGDLTFLRKCATDIADEGITVYMKNGEPYVEVAINGKMQDMIWDSGASSVSLSSQTAAAFGLKTTDQDPTVDMTIADGHVVQCRMIVVPEIRVGPYIAKNVECTILPPSRRWSPEIGSLPARW